MKNGIKPDPTLYHNNPIADHAAHQLLSATLAEKEYMTQVKLDEWYIAWEGSVYLSFSGGKDSTLLAYLTAKNLTENEWFRTPLVLCFIDTGLEYPEIRDFMFIEVLQNILFCPKGERSAAGTFTLKRITAISFPIFSPQKAFRSHGS